MVSGSNALCATCRAHTCSAQSHKSLSMFTDDLLGVLCQRHFSEEMFNEIVGGHCGQIPFQLIHQQQLHLLQREKRGTGRGKERRGRRRGWGGGSVVRAARTRRCRGSAAAAAAAAAPGRARGGPRGSPRQGAAPAGAARGSPRAAQRRAGRAGGAGAAPDPDPIPALSRPHPGPPPHPQLPPAASQRAPLSSFSPIYIFFFF